MSAIRKIFVTDLPWTISSLELRKYFLSFGIVSHAKVHFNKDTGLSKGFGFVTFASVDSVNAVLKSGTHIIDGRPVVIQPVK